VDDEMPASYADIPQKVAGLLRDRDKARQTNDPEQQRAWRHLVHERLEQLVNKLFPEVHVAVNDAAAVTRDMLEPAPDRRRVPVPRLLTTIVTG
jgi:hypothetical protein